MPPDIIAVGEFLDRKNMAAGTENDALAAIDENADIAIMVSGSAVWRK